MMGQQIASRGGLEQKGAAELAASLRSAPQLSSERLGWKDLGICCWRVEVDEYALLDTSETLIALHTEGVVHQRTRRGWGPDRSVPGRVSILPPGTNATFRGGGTLGVTTMHLSDRRLETLVGCEDARRTLAGLPMRFGIVDPLIAASMNTLAEELCHPSAYAAQYAEAIADSLALHVLRSAAHVQAARRIRGGLSEGTLRRVQDRIEADLGGALSIDDLAREAGLSRFHFSRSFRTATGVAPHRYVLERRIERAKAHLRDEALPIAEVALLTGFSSQSHLTDCFRQFVGVAPGEYRRAH